MRIRPRVYDSVLSDLSAAIGAEKRRRGLSYAAIARACSWRSNERRSQLSRFVRGDTSALGYEAALTLVEVLGLELNVNVVPSQRPPRMSNQKVAA